MISAGNSVKVIGVAVIRGRNETPGIPVDVLPHLAGLAPGCENAPPGGDQAGRREEAGAWA